MILAFNTRTKSHEYFTTTTSVMKRTKFEVLEIKKKNFHVSDDNII